ncbi:hypothetical protein QCA50_009769 [Cerrena zonata]|uniref:NAD(P)-binding protein n=1 Tax=Cerrena zonata TaxID=2478898 RepID=A0AAW0GAR0_9APHY
MSSLISSAISSVTHPTTNQVTTTIGAIVLAFLVVLQQRKASALRTAVSANSSFSPSYLPVAIFVGGTGGIGQGTAEAFARHTKGNAHIIIIGRNRVAAETIISKFPKPTAEGAKHEFVYCDLTLMKNIENTTKSLLERLPRVNFLFLSTVSVTKLGREETEEGIDKKLATLYYGRFKFINDMLPALRNAAANHEAATVYCVLGAGRGKEIDWNNLGLKRSYNVFAIREQTIRYVDTITQELAAQNPILSFIHAWPGAVRTNASHSIESIPLRLALKTIMLLAYPISMTYAQSGEYMLYGMLSASEKPGWSRVDEDGTLMTKNEYIASNEERKRLWEHTIEETSRWKNMTL